MDVQPLEVYATDSNYAVVKPPGRQYPGSVIQGDSLCILCGLAVSLACRVRDNQPQDDEFLGDLQELTHSLVGRLLHYQSVLLKHGLALPYSRPLTDEDLIWILPHKTDDR